MYRPEKSVGSTLAAIRRWASATACSAGSFTSTRRPHERVSGTDTVSPALGEYDRNIHSDSVSYQAHHRQRVPGAGEIARLPDHHGLVLQGAEWQLLRLTNWFEREHRQLIATMA